VWLEFSWLDLIVVADRCGEYSNPIEVVKNGVQASCLRWDVGETLTLQENFAVDLGLL
jgi:hypothetical protein